MRRVFPPHTCVSVDAQVFWTLRLTSLTERPPLSARLLVRVAHDLGQCVAAVLFDQIALKGYT